MSRISPEASRVLGPDFLQSIRSSDRCPLLRFVIEAGWTVDAGATLLVKFRESYFGERSRFPNVGSYESAVNGRGIPDDDIEELGRGQIQALMRRGVAFAWDALHAAQALSPQPSLTARISSAPILTEPDIYTGYVTFFSAGFNAELGVESVASPSGIQIIMSSDDCVDSLPE